jgi:UDP-glucose 4-epimerase
MTTLSGLRLLVTGGSGFIGSRICARAAARGAIVHSVARRPQIGTAKGVRPERADLSDVGVTQALVRRVRPDVVLHLGSKVAGARDREHVLPMLRANLVAAVNVMLAAADVGCCRVVLAGSMEEPDRGDPEALVQSPYAAAKAATREYSRLFHDVYELPVVHLRVFMVYGPGQRDLQKLVPYVTLSLLRGQIPKLTSGARKVDWVYVDDVADAFLAAAVAPGVDGSSLDIGSGELVAGRELVGRLCELIDSRIEPDFGALPDRQLERERVADPKPADAALGWRASTPLDAGLVRTVDFYRSQLDRRGQADTLVRPPSPRDQATPDRAPR